MGQILGLSHWDYGSKLGTLSQKDHNLQFHGLQSLSHSHIISSIEAVQKTSHLMSH
jgi:hypothetical protein